MSWNGHRDWRLRSRADFGYWLQNRPCADTATFRPYAEILNCSRASFFKPTRFAERAFRVDQVKQVLT
jgi:hypothetical protein